MTTISYLVVHTENQDGNRIMRLIHLELQQRFNIIKEENPLGYEDQLEQQSDVLLFDAVTKLGGAISEDKGKNGEYIFDFSGVRFTRSGFAKIIDSAIPAMEIASN